MGQSGSSACSTFAEEKASYVGVNFLRSATDRRSPLGNRAHASISLTVMNDNGCIRVRATKRSELDHKGFTPLRKLSGSSGSLLRDMFYLRAGSNTVLYSNLNAPISPPPAFAKGRQTTTMSTRRHMCPPYLFSFHQPTSNR
jgi:hypothetical protein